MIYKRIPDTELSPSAICLGTAQFGTGINQEDSCQMLDAFIDMGGNFIDTAHVYADWIPGEKSVSEKTIGKWIKARGNRERIIIATKGAHPELNNMTVQRLSKQEIAKDLDESLKYLQVDYIDLYWLHRDDPNRPVGEILDTLNEHVKEGKIRYFGCSNWQAARIFEAMDYASKHNVKGFVADQMMWSMAVPNYDRIEDKTLVAMDKEMMELHKKTGLTAIPYSSQAKGFFSKLADQGVESLNDDIKNIYYNTVNMKRFEIAKRLALEISRSITEIALAYLTSQSFPVIPIVGCRTVQQLKESMKASDLTIEPSILELLECPPV